MLGKMRPDLADMPSEDVVGAGGAGQQGAGVGEKGKCVVEVLGLLRVGGKGAAERVVGGGGRGQGDVGGYDVPGTIIGRLVVLRRRGCRRREEGLCCCCLMGISRGVEGVSVAVVCLLLLAAGVCEGAA